MADKPEYTKPTTQLDAERRLAAERGEVETVGAARSFAVEGNDLSAYVGVSPEYQTHADVTQAPFASTTGVEAELEKRQKAALSGGVPKGATSEAERVEPKLAAYNIPAEPPQDSAASKTASTPKSSGSTQAKE